MALFHCVVRLGSAQLITVRLSSGRFAFPLQFSTALEWIRLIPPPPQAVQQAVEEEGRDVRAGVLRHLNS